MSDSTSCTSRISATYIENLLEQLRSEGHKDTTKLAYYNRWKNFNQFLIRLDRMPPMWEDRVCLYVTFLICEKGLQSSTIKSYISAIKSVLRNDDYDWNDGRMILNTLTKSCKFKNDRVKTRLPIQKGLLEMILFDIRKRYLDQPFLEAMYISAYLLAYYGLMRVGELAYSQHSLKAANIHKARLNTSKRRLCLILYSSKTHDESMLPQKIKIYGSNTIEISDQHGSQAYTITDKRKQYFCPVEWVQRYIELRHKISADNDQEQFFQFSDKTNLEARHLRTLLRSCIESFHLDPSLYDTHSFRIGRATDFYKDGTNLDTIKQLGRWRSNAIYKYLRDF